MKKLKQMILEAMISPSALIDDASKDEEVMAKIRDLLSSESDEEKRQGLSFLDVFNSEKYPQGTEDHVHLGSDEYKDAFKKSLPPQMVVKRELDDFYQRPYAPKRRRLTVKYDYRFGGEITVVTSGSSDKDLEQIQRFTQYLRSQGYKVGSISLNAGTFRFSSVIEIQYN